MSAAAMAVDQTPGLTEIRLYGVLGRKFGRVHRLAVRSVREAMQALAVVVPGFGRHMIEHSAPGYQVFIGKRGSNNVGEERLDAPVSAREAICVVPVVAGAKSNGTFQTILGVVIMAVGLYVWDPDIVGYGAALTFGGVAQMIAAQLMGTPDPKPEGLASYNFNGPVNTTQQGLAIPVRYGRVICGGAIISAGILTEQVLPASAGASMPLQSLPANEPVDPIHGGDFSSEGSP